MYPTVTEVFAQKDYVLRVVFATGENGIFDMKPLLDFGVFKRLKDPEYFKKVKVSFDTIEWETGVDLDPEYVYDQCMYNSSA